MANTAEPLEHAPGVFVDKICAGGAPIQLLLHNDGKTTLGLVVRLLREVFDKQERDAIALAKLVLQHGKAVCGRYPPSVAKALLEAAQERIRAEGCPLLITDEAADEADSPDLSDVQFEYAYEALEWHFTNIPPSELATTVRQFPGHMQADVQVAVDKLFADPVRFFGAYAEHRYETLSFARMKKRGQNAISLVPPQYHQVDTGETARRSNACTMDCGSAERANFSLPSCSLLNSSSTKSRGSGLKSLPLRGLAAKPLFSGALTNWNGRYTRHVLIAARFSHSRKLRITAAAQEASWCIDWHQLGART
ncbi:ATP-dependent Clp protease adapter protein ClpS [Bradyrhizobium sp. F1.13.4]